MLTLEMVRGNASKTKGRNFLRNLISWILTLSAILNSAKFDFWSKSARNESQNGQNFCLNIAHPRN